MSNLKQLMFTFGSHVTRHALVFSVILLTQHSMASEQLGVSDFLEQIDRIEASSSAFNPQLAEVYMDLGKSLIDEGNFPDAQDALRRAVQIERINYGLDSLSQTPHLLLLADLDYVLGNSKAAQKALENVYSVSSKHYGSKDKQREK